MGKNLDSLPYINGNLKLASYLTKVMEKTLSTAYLDSLLHINGDFMLAT